MSAKETADIAVTLEAKDWWNPVFLGSTSWSCRMQGARILAFARARGGCAPSRIVLALLTAALSVTLYTDFASGIAFEVSGVMSREQYDYHSGSAKDRETFLFDALVSNSRYLASVRKVEGLAPQEVPETITGSDGTDSFDIINAPQPFGGVVVNSGTYPRHTLGPNQIIWLAFASQSYLDNFSNKNQVPIAGVLGLYSADEVSFVIERFAEEPKLPMNLRIISPNYRYEEGPPGTKRQKLPFRHGLEIGYVMAEYTVLSLTNINGIRLPCKFHFKWFAPKASAKSTEDVTLKTLETYMVTNASADVDSNRLLLKPQRSFSVLDYRFSGQLAGEPVLYSVTGAVLRPKNDPIVLREFSAAKHRLAQWQKEEERLPARKLYSTVLVLCFLLLPVLIILWRRHKRQLPKP
jgi:hypothetical protein